MKKFLAMGMATAMVFSLSAVSLAAARDETHQGVVAVDEIAYKYGTDDNYMKAMVIEYGKAAYYALYASNDDGQFIGGQDEATCRDEDTFVLVSNSEMVDGMKVKVDYEMGKELVAENGVSIVKKKVEEVRSAGLLKDAFERTNNGDGGYFYFIEIKTLPRETTSDADIIATLEINKSKKGDDEDASGEKLNYKVKDLQVDISTNVGYEKSYLDSGDGAYTELMVETDTVGDGIAGGLEPEEYYLLKYDYDDEVEFTFGGMDDQNEGVFTVDVSGQGKNILYYDTILDDAIAAANPDAKIFALRFHNTKFNRTGDFTYEGEDFEYAYQLMEDGSLKLLGEFDGEEVTFKTRVLGSYLFSDTELVAAPAESETVVTPSEDVPTVEVSNPATGAMA